MVNVTMMFFQTSLNYWVVVQEVRHFGKSLKEQNLAYGTLVEKIIRT